MSEPAFPVVGLAGWSGAGKTTFGIKLVQELRARGLRVAIIKHATHRGIVTDAEGSDTQRYAQAGADLVVLATPRQLVNWRRLDQEPSLTDILKGLSNVDLAIVEGYRRAEMPRIEVWRREQGGAPITPDNQLIAWVSDGEKRADVPNLTLEDVAGAADLLCAWFGLR